MVDGEAYVALLRGVNVAGRRLPMAELREGMADRGFPGARTYLQSGNLVVKADEAPPGELRAAVVAVAGEITGYDIDALVLGAREFLGVAGGNPFLGREGVAEEHLHVTFLFGEVAGTAFDELELPVREGEEAAFAGRVVYLLLPKGYGRTKVNNAFFERALGTPATTRNWRTVRALVDLL